MTHADYTAIPTTDLHHPDTADPGLTTMVEAELAAVTDELRRADAKATALTGLFGAALAGLIALTRQDLSTAATVLLAVAAVPMAGALVQLLLVLRPQVLTLTRGFSRWALFTDKPAELLADLATHRRHIARIGAADLADLARHARRKYQRITGAVHLLLIGLALLALALPLA